ncbi:MAG: FAD-dependent tricarballylate dehydrogenase TcuA, partial [Chloroflexi bacterium]|nr:FAD-dependent tricarballylate dehydrogenase TcuA [Chloroflexota bacterium]
MAETSDVVVVGSGVAGLTAALAAADSGERVSVLEKAPYERRGGNGRFTGGFRCVTSAYPQQDYFNDLMNMSNGRADPYLCEVMVANSADTIKWLGQVGVKWDVADHAVEYYVMVGRRDVPQVLGGGEALIDTLITSAEKRGVKILYEAKAVEILLDARARVEGVRAKLPGGFTNLKCKAIVLASGGFESNTEMRVRYLRPDGDELIIRGTRHNTGEGLQMALDIGAQPFGQFAGYDSTIMDARTPRVEGGSTNIRKQNLAVIVNKYGKRFINEGLHFHEKMHSFGRFMFNQDGHVAFCIFDSKIKDLSRYSSVDRHRIPPLAADTLEDLAKQCDIDASQLVRTITEFNRAVQPGNYDPFILDGKCTKGIDPPKTNWALEVDTPPYYVFPVTGGITFTFGGLKVNGDGQVIDVDDKPIPGLFATGEILGGFYYDFYLG